MTFGRLVLKLGWTLRGNRPFAAFRQLQRHRRMSPADLKTMQNELLRKVIRHAYEQTPYYAELFRRHSLTPDDIRTVEDLPKIPLLTKDVMRREHERMLARNEDVRRLHVSHTGGSTGTPTRVYYSKERSDWTVAGLWRNYVQCGWQPGEVIGMLWGFRERDWAMPPWKMRVREFLSRTCRNDPFSLSRDGLRAVVRRLQAARPSILLGYASALDLLAKHMIESGERIERLKGIFSSAEVLYPEARRRMEQAWGCPVFDFYGSVEIPHVACDCERGRMHQYTDMVVLERGEAAGPDGHDDVVVTGLRNYAMPLIRYVNGDAARFDDDGACECGSPFPTLRLSVARTTDYFRFGNGRLVHGEFFTHRLSPALGISAFQFHQVREDLIYLRIVPGARFGDQDRAVIETACAVIRERSEGTTRCEVLTVDQIERTAAGKHRFTRSDLSIEP